MANINPSDLIAKFEIAITNNWGYIYGMTHEMWSTAKQAEYIQKYSNDSDRKNSCEYGGKWAGHWVTDCSGLFAWAFSELGGKMYHGSNTMYLSWCTAKGKLSKGKRTDGHELKPGTAVFVLNSKGIYSHVGLYIGNGIVIEAMGAKNGVVKSKVTLDKWSHWGELKGVAYGESPKPEPIPSGYAKVTGKRVALRTSPSTSAGIIMRIDTGELVKVEQPPPTAWEYVSYNGKSGYMMKEYLQEG